MIQTKEEWDNKIKDLWKYIHDVFPRGCMGISCGDCELNNTPTCKILTDLIHEVNK